MNQSVQASAGTGKTFELAQRVLTHVAEGVPIQRIVVVTFTDAATAELSDRIRARLRDAAACLRDSAPAPDPVLAAFIAERASKALVLERLEQALIDFDLAPISTIHGFCSAALVRYALWTGSSLDSVLVAEVGTLLDRLVDDVYLRLVHEAPPSVFAGLREAGLEHAVLRDLAQKVLADPGVEIIPPDPGGVLPDLTAWREAVAQLQAAFEEEGDTLAETLAGSPALYHRRGTVTCAYPAGGTRKAVDELRRFVRAPRLLGDLKGLEPFTTPFLQTATKPGEVAPTLAVVEAVDRCVAVQARLAPALRDWGLSTKHALIHAARTWIPAWKQREELRTYTDLLHHLADALEGEDGAALREQLAASWDLALVDEFQDTDPVQWRILDAVFSPRLTVVGDPKQAIYSFRGADVHTYLQVIRACSPGSVLSTSFRTDGPLLDALNHLYQRHPDPFLGQPASVPEVQAAHREARLHGDDARPLHIRFVPRDAPGARTRGKVLAVGATRDLLVEVVAEDVARTLAQGLAITEGRARRALTPGDCAVLTRTNPEAARVREALQRLGIPAVIRGADSVFQTETAAELVAILEGWLTPEDAGAVCRALVTPLMGRTGDELVALRRSGRRWAEELERFGRWRTLWLDRGFIHAFQAWLDDDGVPRRLLARAGGDRILTDLRHLAELTHEAAEQARLGPAGVLTWLRRGGPTVDEEQASRRLESDGDAVRVLTVHSAKGLEFPLVWCPFLWSEGFAHRNDERHTRFFDADAGRWRLDIGSEDQDAHVEALRRDAHREELRLIYVALTRARHRCTLYHGVVGGVHGPLAYLLYGRGEDPGKTARSLQYQGDRALRDALTELAQHPGIGWDEVRWRDRPEAPAGPGWSEDPDLLRPASPSRSALDRWWRRSSFSDLVRGNEEPHAAWVPPPPEDRDDEPPEEEAETGRGDDSELAVLRGGRRTGVLLHRILELADFQDPDHVRAVTRRELQAVGHSADLADPVARALNDALATPLEPDGQPLNQVSRRQRLDELEFLFPALGGYEGRPGAVRPRDLARVLAPDAADLPAGIVERITCLGFLPVRGFVHGFVDLVFERGGRYFVVDWKSNRLGPTYRHYGRDALSEAMGARFYTLQYHLYVVALHRLLKWRLGSAYRPEEHLGGVYYLFLRGMRPEWGPEFGIYRDRPPVARIERLDALLSRGTP